MRPASSGASAGPTITSRPLQGLTGSGRYSSPWPSQEPETRFTCGIQVHARLHHVQILVCLSVLERDRPGYRRSTSSSASLENSPALRVTGTCGLAMAMEAIMRSFPPTGLPSRRSCALAVPCVPRRLVVERQRLEGPEECLRPVRGLGGPRGIPGPKMQFRLHDAAMVHGAAGLLEQTCRRLLVGPIDERHADAGIERPHCEKRSASPGGGSPGTTTSPMR